MTPPAATAAEPLPYAVEIGRDREPFAQYAAARARLLHLAATERATVTLWQRGPQYAERGILDDRPAYTWLLVTLENPAPVRYDIRHTPDCDDRDPSCYACPRIHRAPHAWANLFAGWTLSPLFHLSRGTRDRLKSLGWPAPDDATGWLYPGTADAPAPQPAPPAAAPLPTAPPAHVVSGVDTVALAARPECRVSAEVLAARLRLGWKVTDAMSTPVDTAPGNAYSHAADTYDRPPAGPRRPRR